jgi:hypothetical protein
VVDAGRLPIEDAGELIADDQELVLVDVAMDEDVSMASAQAEELGPSSQLTPAANPVGCLSRGPRTGLGVEGAAQPDHVGALVVGGGPGAGKLGRGEVVPLGDGTSELVEHDAGIGRTPAMESGDGRERERVDGVIPPLADEAGDDSEPGRLEGAVGVQLAFELLDVVRPAREEKGPVVAEQDVLVPPREVDGEGRVAELHERSEASKLWRSEHGPQRLPDDRRTHGAQLAFLRIEHLFGRVGVHGRGPHP